MDMSDETIARVSSLSVTSKVAGAIAGIMREKGRVIVQAIGTSTCY
jgi:stage V sporulation protein SpoVS